LPLFLACPCPQVTFVKKGVEKTCEISPNDYLLDGADESRIELNASCRGERVGGVVGRDGGD